MSTWHSVRCDAWVPGRYPGLQEQCPVQGPLLEVWPEADRNTTACLAKLIEIDSISTSGWACLATGEMRCPAHYDAAEAARIHREAAGRRERQRP